MRERILAELDLLRGKYPDLKHDEDLRWVLIPHFQLPLGRFNREETDLLFSLPVGYPNTGPDNFFVAVSLRLKDSNMPSSFNSNPNSSTGPALVPGDWGWFSWHPSSWRPAATVEGGDNLASFVRAINMCLRGEEVP